MIINQFWSLVKGRSSGFSLVVLGYLGKTKNHDLRPNWWPRP